MRVEFSITDPADAMIHDILHRAMHLGALLEDFGEYMLLRTEDCFREETDPWGKRWQDLAPVTWRQKRNDKILTESTALRGEITYQVQSGRLSVQTGPRSVDYAAIQQFGGDAGRRHAAHIPARPFLAFTDHDLQVLAARAMEYLL